MTFEISTALREGFERTLSRNGLLLIGVFVAFGLANAVVSQSLSAATVRLVEQTEPLGPGAGPLTGRAELPFALGVPATLAAALSVLVFVVEEGLRVFSIRAFASEHTERMPSEFTRRGARATAHSVVASVIVAALTVLGLVLLVVPGVYVALSFFFVRQEIAVEDKGVVEALRDSWALTDGDRWELLGLAVLVAVVNLLAGLPSAAFGFLNPVAGALVAVSVGAVTTVFGVAAATRAYVQLREERAGNEGDTRLDDAEEWNDPDGV